MALPISLATATNIPGEDERQALIAYDTRLLTDRLAVLDKYRDYYDGEQALTFSTKEFKDAFGDQFGDFRDNWCEVVVDATEERIDLERIVFRDADGNESKDQSDAVWEVLLNNEFEEIQNELYNFALVEGSSYIIVWPDDELGVRVDAQDPRNVLVTYETDDNKRMVRAIKRWIAPSGEQRLTLYLPDFIYKYKIETLTVRDTDQAPRDTGWTVRPVTETGDPSWPLPNPFGMIPIVEFPNRNGASEIKNTIPLQDAMNKTLMDMMVAGEFGAFRQTYIVSSNKEPEGGWRSAPGYVWHIQPEVDADGRALPTQVGTLLATELKGYISAAETFLQHIAATSRTPAHYFYLSSRQGGRGDAPSGESLRVAETGLLKKVRKLHETWGLRWIRVARLIAFALANFEGEFSDIPILGKTTWKHPMAHFLMILLEEARKMIDELRLPPKIAWRHIGLSEDEIAEAGTWLNSPEAQTFATMGSPPNSPQTESTGDGE